MRKMTWNEPEDEMNMTMNEYEHEHENDSKVKTNEDEHEVNDEEAKLMETAKWTNDGNESDEHERKNDKNKCEEWDNEVGRMTMITKMSEMKRHEKVKTDEHEHWMITEARKRCRDRKKTNRYTSKGVKEIKKKEKKRKTELEMRMRHEPDENKYKPKSFTSINKKFEGKSNEREKDKKNNSNIKSLSSNTHDIRKLLITTTNKDNERDNELCLHADYLGEGGSTPVTND